MEAAAAAHPIAQPLAVIHVKTQGLALDWSLVLASQGIETRIEHAPELNAWALVVRAEDQARAVEAIRQYRIENRRKVWHRTLPEAQLHWHGGALVWSVALMLLHWLAAGWMPALAERGMITSDAVTGGEWWRLFTAIWLHADIGHLATNAATGFVFLGLAMARFEPGPALLLSLLAGVAGNLAGLALHARPYWALGSSGMVMGALGLVAAQSVALWRETPSAGRYVLSGVGAGGFLFLLLGTNPASDVTAHTGGFLTGLCFGALLSLVPVSSPGYRRLRLVALILFCVCIGLTWALALR
jgi:membrane associated rhomboid family serine protease